MKNAAILIIRVFILRLKSKTPKFFKVLQGISILLTIISSIIVYLDHATKLPIPETLSFICEHLVGFAISMGITSQLTSSDPTKIDDEVNKKQNPQ